MRANGWRDPTMNRIPMQTSLCPRIGSVLYPVRVVLLWMGFHLVWAGASGAVLESGVYQTLPEAAVNERGDRVPDGSRDVPLAASLTFDLAASQPTVSAVIPNAVLEGGSPFLLTVHSQSGIHLADGSYRFSGDYLRDLIPVGTQYGFDWTFSLTTDGQIVWKGLMDWGGGHLWLVSIAELNIVPSTVPPRLEIVAAGGQVTVSWPAVFPGYVLEKSTNLSVPDWSGVTDPADIVGNRYSVTLDASTAPGFFRLHKP